jgi:hypothetical protein
MFNDNPTVKERWLALGAFGGIAVFAVAAVDVMLTGGFDFAPARTVSDRAQPSAYVRVVDAANYVTDRVSSVSWDEARLIDEASAATTEELAGADDGSSTSDALYAEIDALYRQSDPETANIDAPSYQDAPAYDDGAYEDEFSPEEAEKLASASGNG